ncbi:MAG: hypothetical protein JSW20_14440 [Nitrospiraceae bacterium]|nr:MAG: hypothetical protein JSW20_14440 [Nitrospiraceae bacterium]
MLKKLLKYFSFSLLFFFIACAPKPKLLPPPLYEEAELSLEDIISKASSDVYSLKAISTIRIEKNDEHYTTFSASSIIKKPDWVHMRVYQLGMLVRDFVIKDNTLYVLSGKQDLNLKDLGKEMHNAVFWWEGLQDSTLTVRKEEYIISAFNKKLYLDRDTLLPDKQIINSEQGLIVIKYEEPKETDGYWYNSIITINLNSFTFRVKLKKLIKNPAPGEADFRVENH